MTSMQIVLKKLSIIVYYAKVLISCVYDNSLLRESNEWTSLPISTVISYISSDDLDVPSEQVSPTIVVS